MTYIYNDDLTQYDRAYWSKVNYYRLAGTTVDTQKREKTSFAEGYTSTKDFVGGATNGEYGTAAMYLESYRNSDNAEYPIHNSTLEARKSWFMFDDEIVALGAGINAEDGYEVDAIVENRKSNNVKTISDPDVTVYEVKSVSARKSYFDIEISEDGTSWTKAFSGESSGKQMISRDMIPAELREDT